MKKFFRDDTSITIMEAIFLGLYVILEIGHQITKLIDYIKEKKLNRQSEAKRLKQGALAFKKYFLLYFLKGDVYENIYQSSCNLRNNWGSWNFFLGYSSRNHCGTYRSYITITRCSRSSRYCVNLQIN